MSTSSSPLHYALFQQSGVSSFNCTESRAIHCLMLTAVYDSTVVNNTIAQWRWVSDDPIGVNYFEKDVLLGFFISQICWVVVLWIVKCSILAFYWRLFSCNSRSTRLVIWTIAVAVMCWGISVVGLLFLICWLGFRSTHGHGL